MSEMFAGGVLGFFVGWFVTVFIINWTEDHNKSQSTCKAPKREWVGLNYRDSIRIIEQCESNIKILNGANKFELLEFIEMIEAKLKEKNT